MAWERKEQRDWKQREQMYRITQTGLEVCFSTLDSSTVSVKQTVALSCPSWLHLIIPVSCRKKLFFQNVRKSRKEHDSFKPARYSLKPKGQIVFSTQVLRVEKSSKSKKPLTNFLNRFFLHAPPIFHSSSLFFFTVYPIFLLFHPRSFLLHILLTLLPFFVFTLHPFPLLSQFCSAFFLSTILKSAYLWLLILLFCSDNCKKKTITKENKSQLAHLNFTPWCGTWVANLMATNLGYSRYVSGKVESFGEPSQQEIKSITKQDKFGSALKK